MKYFATTIVRDRWGRVLLLHYPNSFLGWKFPGGKVETSESPLQAAVRELKEETGIVAEENDLVFLKVNTVPVDGVLWIGYYFEMKPRPGKREEVTVEDKACCYRWDFPEQLLDLRGKDADLTDYNMAKITQP